MRILCLERSSRYRLMNAFLDAFAAGARAHGHTVFRAPVGRVVATTKRPPVDLVFSFGGVGSGAKWDVPFLTWLVDHPVFTAELPELDPGRDGVLVVAGEHIGVVHDFLGVRVPAGFVPHGIAVPPDWLPPSFDDTERPIDVLVAGSYRPRPQPSWNTPDERVGALLDTLLRSADERWDRHVRALEVSALFREVAEEFGAPTDHAAHRTMAPWLAWLDEDLRLRRRAACVRALDRAGVSLCLVGAGWEQLEPLEHATLAGPVRHTDVLRMTRRAKVVLNVGPPLFNHGWHERVPMAMAGGALAVSEANDFLAADPALADLVETYEMTDLDVLADKVRAALGDPQRRLRTRAAWETVRTEHSWAHRAANVLEMIEL